MAIISWALWGLFAGAVARFIKPGRQPIGILGTMVVGLVGALVGGFIATHVLHIADDSNFDFGSFLIAVAGAFILLALWEPYERRRQRRETPPSPV
jgi:uncharacterized membrane protein YeaQ/YmgE (transglycosylase-associated protein family)